MATIPEKQAGPRFLDKAEVKAIFDRAFADMGFVPDPTATAERSQGRMHAPGIKPEENVFSRGIIAMREE